VKAADIERKYQELCVGGAQPVLAFISGRTLKLMKHDSGVDFLDDQGSKICEDETYALLSSGIFRVE
jgi:hypothetical protein